MNWINRLRMARHLRGCPRCSRQVEELRGVREWLHGQETDLPAGLNWDRMAAEMRANIRLGLAAGQCVALPNERPVRVLWRAPALALPVLLVVVAGWVLQSLHPPLNPQWRAARDPGVLLQAGSEGIGFEQDGRGFALLHPKDGNPVYTVRGPVALRARYVDADTGQVTIRTVYAE